MHTVSLGVGMLVGVGVLVVVFAYKMGWAMSDAAWERKIKRLEREMRRRHDSENGWMWKR